MASNYTENYGLCQWEATDAVLRTEFNEDNRKIDEALGCLTGCNCQVSIKPYIGTGESGPVVHTFPYRPMFIMILSVSGGTWVYSARGCSVISGHLFINTYVNRNIAWEDRSVAIGTTEDSAYYCCNSKDSHYCMIALLDVQD